MSSAIASNLRYCEMAVTSNLAILAARYVLIANPLDATVGGSYPKWRSDGKELFFLAVDGKLMAVPIGSTGGRNPASTGGLEPGAPQALFDIGDNLGVTWPYQPSAGGQHFLLALPPSSEKPPPITVVLNWQSGLRK